MGLCVPAASFLHDQHVLIATILSGLFFTFLKMMSHFSDSSHCYYYYYFKRFTFIVCLSVCLCIYTICMDYLRRPEEGVTYPGTGVTGSRESPNVGAGN